MGEPEVISELDKMINEHGSLLVRALTGGIKVKDDSKIRVKHEYIHYGVKIAEKLMFLMLLNDAKELEVDDLPETKCIHTYLIVCQRALTQFGYNLTWDETCENIFLQRDPEISALIDRSDFYRNGYVIRENDTSLNTLRAINMAVEILERGSVVV